MRDAIAHEDYVTHGPHDAYSKAAEHDYFSLAAEAGVSTVPDLLDGYVGETILTHEHNANADDDFGELLGHLDIELDEEERESCEAASIGIYEDAITDVLTHIQRLFPEVYVQIEAKLPQLRHTAQERLSDLQRQLPKEIRYKPKRSKKPLH